MGVWNEIKEPGSLSPDGFNPIPRSGRHPTTGAVQSALLLLGTSYRPAAQ
jgi:hypothetical protein